jgi:hypothetical protein
MLYSHFLDDLTVTGTTEVVLEMRLITEEVKIDFQHILRGVGNFKTRVQIQEEIDLNLEELIELLKEETPVLSIIEETPRHKILEEVREDCKLMNLPEITPKEIE